MLRSWDFFLTTNCQARTAGLSSLSQFLIVSRNFPQSQYAFVLYLFYHLYHLHPSPIVAGVFLCTPALAVKKGASL
jgi:hypothetical protein